MALFNSIDSDIDSDEIQPERQKQQTLSLILGLLIGFIIMVAVHLAFNHYLKKLSNQSDAQEAMLEATRAETNQVIEQRKQNEKLAKECHLLQRLTAQANESREILNQLHKIAIDNVIITDFRQRKNVITVKGETDSIIKLQRFLQQLKQIHYFSGIGLTAINHLPRTKYFYFVLMTGGLSAD